MTHNQDSRLAHTHTHRPVESTPLLYLLLLDLALQGRDLDLHLLDLVLGQHLDAGARVRVVQGLEGQVGQRDVPLALVLLVAAAGEERGY